MRVRSFFVVSLALALASALAGCTDDGGRRRPMGGTDGGPNVGGETGDQCADGIDNDRDGVSDCDEATCSGHPACARDAGPPGDGGFATCDELPFQAETAYAPVDIVWIIDNSGSMNDEAAMIQDNMNAFVGAIAASGIEDYRVVVITQAGFVNVPPPLGTDTERFRFVADNVQSSDALSHILGTYSQWRDFLRRDATLHIVHVTDDESDMAWESFRSMFMSMLGRSWTSHAIVSPPGEGEEICFPGFGCMAVGGCTGPHGDAAAPGNEYWELAGATGGRQISICTPDWSDAFGALLSSIAVPRPIPCEFAIPEPPEGMEFDRRRVNVDYTPGDGSPRVRFPFVGTPDGANCPADGDGWYYDDPESPRQIVLCPSTCSRTTGDASGRIDIALGCESLII